MLHLHLHLYLCLWTEIFSFTHSEKEDTASRMATLLKSSLLVRTIFIPFTSHFQNPNQKRIKRRRRRKSPNQQHRFQSLSLSKRLWNFWANTRERFKIAFNDFVNWYLWSLIDDAKENPNDSAIQTTALPVEPNLHRFHFDSHSLWNQKFKFSKIVQDLNKT